MYQYSLSPRTSSIQNVEWNLLPPGICTAPVKLFKEGIQNLDLLNLLHKTHFKIVVGYTGVMFQIPLGTSWHAWCSIIHWAYHVDAFFIEISQKWDSAAKKKLSLWGSETDNSGQIWYFTSCWFCSCYVSVLGQRIHFWKFRKNQTIRSQ